MPLPDFKDVISQNWVTIVTGFAGIVIGIFAAYSFRPRSRLATQTNSLEVLGRRPVLPAEISFVFRGQQVPSVTLSRIALWNVGNTTLKGDQIVAADPLRIVTSTGSNCLTHLLSGGPVT